MASNPGNVVLTTFYLDLSSSQCGYPICCPGDQPHFQPVPFLPENIQTLNIESDVKQVMGEIDGIFHNTGMPMFPCILHHFCLPFSPICAAFYCLSQRKSGIDEVLAKWNNEKGIPQGLCLAFNQDYQMMYQNTGRGARYAMLMLKPGMEVQMNVNQRQQYCSKHGLHFDPSIIPAQPAPNPFNPLSYSGMTNPPPGAYPPPAMQPPPGHYPGSPPYGPQAGQPAPYPPPSAPAPYGAPAGYDAAVTEQPSPSYNQVYDEKSGHM